MTPLLTFDVEERRAPDDPLLSAGQRFAGRVVVARIGRGGSSEVYRVLTDDGSDQALKVVLPGVARTESGRARFLRECEIAQELHHPNVVRVHAHGQDGVDGALAGAAPLLWSAMELLDGGTAERLVPRTRRRPDVALVLEVARQAAEGLDHVHRLEVVHRDVKPANVLLSSGPAPRAAVTDFGIARFLDDARPLARNGRVAGSLPYAAPEVLQAHRLTPAADVYSLGCTVVELLSGLPPYPRNTPFDISRAHIASAPPRVSRRRRYLPKALDVVVARALAKDPGERHATCAAFVRDVAGALDLDLPAAD